MHDPFPASLSLRGAGMVFAVDPGAKSSAGPLFAAPGRHLVSGFVEPAESRIVRARLSLPDEIPLPTDQYAYQLAGSVRLLVTDSAVDGDSSWTIRTDSLVRLNGLEAARTGPWHPSVALDQQVDAATRAPRPAPRTHRRIRRVPPTSVWRPSDWQNCRRNCVKRRIPCPGRTAAAPHASRRPQNGPRSTSGPASPPSAEAVPLTTG
ncbi:hypothetical protein ADK76_27130 [Streptomyces griseoflavus]|uniref:hypothetical protein n=1 Tax=Streptomyces rimosus TaxID=1927 RepID=UPI0004C4BED6|nr:hypothetical protein [Streptomyces rimosus]KOG53514.1 hypothetical protein ADK76_27130 [Streptomyces griseoflavus]